jgi:hypothetical protein
MTLEEDKSHFLDLAQYYFPMGYKTQGISSNASVVLRGKVKYIPRISQTMMLLRHVYEEIPFDKLQHPDFEPLFKAKELLERLEGATSFFLQEPTSEIYSLINYLCTSFIRQGNIYRDTINSLGERIAKEDKEFLNQTHKSIVDIRKPGRFIRRGAI